MDTQNLVFYIDTIESITLQTKRLLGSLWLLIVFACILGDEYDRKESAYWLCISILE